jgi:acyl-CoA thioester hydrolase
MSEPTAEPPSRTTPASPSTPASPAPATSPSPAPGAEDESAKPFSVAITVRGYETDTQGHLNQSVYLQYAEHARWALLQAAGIRQQDLVGQGVGPVVLETTIRYLRELHAGDETEMTCEFADRDSSKTFEIRQTLTKADGTVAAELTAVGGLLDLKERRLITDPRGYLRKLASAPAAYDI